MNKKVVLFPKRLCYDFHARFIGRAGRPPHRRGSCLQTIGLDPRGSSGSPEVSRMERSRRDGVGCPPTRTATKSRFDSEAQWRERRNELNYTNGLSDNEDTSAPRAGRGALAPAMVEADGARLSDFDLAPVPPRRVVRLPPEVLETLPTLLIAESGRTQGIFFEYFEALNVRNPGTREAYERAVRRFLEWCADRGVAGLEYVTPIHISRYVDTLRETLAPPTIKVHIAALRKCFDHLVSEHVIALNPARSVESPRHVVRVGLTPVLDSVQTRELLDSIPVDNICGIRDRAIIGTMVFTFGRVGAVVAMDVADYHLSGRHRMFRLHEKGGKAHDVPAHHAAREYIEDYLDAGELWRQPSAPLFQPVTPDRKSLKGKRMRRFDVYNMIKRRAKRAGLPETTTCHTFRATGITTYLENGGSLEEARKIAAHSSSQTTRLYDRTQDQVALGEIERIRI